VVHDKQTVFQFWITLKPTRPEIRLQCSAYFSDLHVQKKSVVGHGIVMHYRDQTAVFLIIYFIKYRKLFQINMTSEVLMAVKMSCWSCGL
jgi:hypothetical protein